MLSDTMSSFSEQENSNYQFELNSMSSLFETSKSLHNLLIKAFLKCFFLTKDMKNFQTYENLSLLSKDKDKEFWVFCSKVSVEELLSSLKQEIEAKTYEDSVELACYDESLKKETLDHFVVFESVRKLTKSRLLKIIQKYSTIQEFLGSNPSLSISKISVILLCAVSKFTPEADDSMKHLTQVPNDSKISCTILGHLHIKPELSISDELEKLDASMKAILQEKKRLFASPWDRELVAFRKPREKDMISGDSRQSSQLSRERSRAKEKEGIRKKAVDEAFEDDLLLGSLEDDQDKKETKKRSRAPNKGITEKFAKYLGTRDKNQGDKDEKKFKEGSH